MKVLHIIIRKDGATLSLPEPQGPTEVVGSEEIKFKQRLKDFAAAVGGSASSVCIFISEELLFFKSFELPLKTPNLKEAIQYQLSVIVPFPEDSFYYSYSSLRQEGKHKISLYAVQRQLIDMYLQDITRAGFSIIGLFPETQQYILRSGKKKRWGLLTPGQHAKLTVVSGTHVEERIHCTSDVEFEKLSELCGCGTIYHFNPPAGSAFLFGAKLLNQKPLLKEFDMLPASYRRPDYYKIIIPALLVLNIIALVGLTGLKVYSLHSTANQVEAEINKIMPLVKEMKALQEQDQKLSSALDQIERIGTNPDLISFLAKLTSSLPQDSYLDQIRMDKQTGALQIQGYTNDISSLTSGLQNLGDITLKSTSRRKNQTYFQLEITLK